MPARPTNDKPRFRLLRFRQRVEKRSGLTPALLNLLNEIVTEHPAVLAMGVGFGFNSLYGRFPTDADWAVYMTPEQDKARREEYRRVEALRGGRL